MTSGSFTSYQISEITKGPRQRKVIDRAKLETLASSISRLGLIHPIVISRDGVLIAGERRLEACRQLGHSHISIQFIEELDDITIRKIELEENIKRVDLTWQEQVLATEELHLMMKAEDPTWNMEDTAEKLGLSDSYISKRLEIAKEMKHNPRVAAAKQISIAYGLTERIAERRKSAEIDSVLPSKQEYSPILNEDFLTWAVKYSGPKFNFLHCDFPYGINYDKSDQSAAAVAKGDYDDSAATFDSLVDALDKHWNNIMLESCHVMFWFPMKAYEDLYPLLRKLPVFWNPVPLIWLKSDNAGILPAPSYGPRQIYETCFFGYGGGRKIISAVANAVPAPTGRSTRFHLSEKPLPVLTHFFRMFVDQHTSLLDPTCGSGTALRAAELLNAHRVCGIEKNSEYADAATKALREARAMRKVSEKMGGTK